MVTTKDFVKRRKTELEGQNLQSNWVYIWVEGLNGHI